MSEIKPETISDVKILLGSGSPRRRQLLAMMDIPYEPIKIDDVKEVYPASLPAAEVPAFLSQLKADHYRNRLHDNEVLITADTVVVIDDKILGKPADRADAHAMLRELSGRTHHVISGVTLTSTAKSETFTEVTDVHFNELTDENIDYYLDHYKPYDKAGAYGIQEWIGLVGIRGIDGCFYNVMGLPTSALLRHLTAFIDN